MRTVVWIGAAALFLALAACGKPEEEAGKATEAAKPNEAVAPPQPSAAPAASLETLRRKSGLWEEQTVVRWERGPRGDPPETKSSTSLICVDRQGETGGMGLPPPPATCKDKSVRRLGGGFEFERVCSYGSIKAAGDVDSSYKVEWVFSPSRAEDRGFESESVATWRGVCPPDMKPGDQRTTQPSSPGG